MRLNQLELKTKERERLKFLVLSCLIFAEFGFAQPTTKPDPPEPEYRSSRTQYQAQSSIIYVYRPQAMMKGRWLHPSIYCDGKELTRIYRGTVFMTTIPPGRHIITLGRTEVGQFVDMEPGRKYYFRFGHKNILVTAVSGREPLTLTQVDEAVALQEMDGLKHSSKESK